MAKILRSKRNQKAKSQPNQEETNKKTVTPKSGKDWSYECTGISFERKNGQRTLIVEVDNGNITYNEYDFPKLAKKASIKKAIATLNSHQELSAMNQRKLRKYVANVLHNNAANPAGATIGELAPAINDVEVDEGTMDKAANQSKKKSTGKTEKFQYKNGSVAIGQYLEAEQAFKMEIDGTNVALYEEHEDLSDLLKCEIEIKKMPNGDVYGKFVRSLEKPAYNPAPDVKQFLGAYGNRTVFNDKGEVNNDGILEAYTMDGMKELLADATDPSSAYEVLAETFGSITDSIVKISIEINGTVHECLASIQSLMVEDTQE